MIFGHSRLKIIHIHLFLSIYFLIKWLFHIDMSFILFFMISLFCYGVWFYVIVVLFFFRHVPIFYLGVDDLDG